MGLLYVQLLWLVLDGLSLPPDAIPQPPGHGIHQVIQEHIHEVLILLVRTVFVTPSSIEVATSWDFLLVCGLPLCWCWQFFIIIGQKFFVWQASLHKKRKRRLLWWQASYFSCKKTRQTKNGQWKMVSISTRTGHRHRKNLRALQLPWRMQL